MEVNKSSNENLNTSATNNNDAKQTNSQFPQTGNESTFWATGLGMFLLAILGVFDFRRRN
ncbi:LPXTG cell wall anchor domain-containing protein [Companilactobacillus keshanensis]|uniref:LPXTG cell wall anchor domain-containing protein n=1 Tax=Companilactobacillus keshanensis TaxID=2486003 RepID=A0ABW4BQN9_9LACO